MAHEPFDEQEIERLRFEAGFYESKDQAKICAILQVAAHRSIEADTILLRALRKSVSWQIHQPPGLVDRKDVDELCEPRLGRDAGQPLLPCQHVQQRRLADV
ncbi:hypothetical protein SDC9_196003 [bioreactor metagenome]|uniref:Uncharacterized protein n=1 Tax=bioreactor metagenome TaxID=1076179 RepID=A0A645IBU5_9ZZZZ